jgi:hypothetical protein
VSKHKFNEYHQKVGHCHVVKFTVTVNDSVSKLNQGVEQKPEMVKEEEFGDLSERQDQ